MLDSLAVGGASGLLQSRGVAELKMAARTEASGPTTTCLGLKTDVQFPQL